MNVLLVAIDTLSARHMRCCGFPRDTCPFMDRPAAAASHAVTGRGVCALFPGLGLDLKIARVYIVSGG